MVAVPTRSFVIRGIFSGAAVYGALSAAARVIGFGKEIIVAHLFGVSAHLDAYLIALIVPTFLVNIVSVSLTYVVVPRYLVQRADDGATDPRHSLSSAVATIILAHIALVPVLAAVGVVFVPYFAEDLPPATAELSSSLYLILLATFLFGGLRALWGALLEAERRFTVAAAAQAVTPAVIAVALLSSAHADSPWLLASATSAGTILEALLVGFALSRIRLPVIGSGANWAELRVLARKAGPIMLGAMMMSGSVALDQAMAARLGPAAVSTYGFGVRITNALLTVGASFWAVAFPFFSSFAGASDWLKLRRAFFITAGFAACVGLAMAAALAFTAVPLISLVFEHGALGHTAAIDAAAVHRLFVLQLPIYAVAMITFRVLMALGRNDIVFAISASALIAKFGLNAWLMTVLGLPGIALATPLMFFGMAVSAVLCVTVILNRRLSHSPTAV